MLAVGARSEAVSKSQNCRLTINSERWVRALIDYYDGINAVSIFAVDRRTTDRTRDVISRRGKSFVDVSGKWPRRISIARYCF